MPLKAVMAAACMAALLFPALAQSAAAQAATAQSAQAAPRFDPSAWRTRTQQGATQVLVLGTPHLSGTPDDFDPAVLEPLLERLAGFRPDVIAIESLSGESLTTMRSYSAIYRETAQDYGGRPFKLGNMGWYGTGLDMPAAEAEARKLLAAWPASPTPAQRRRLAAVLAASGDPSSALVQWWRLDPAERKAEDGVTADLVTALNEYDKRRNENHLIGSRLAVRLGLERLFPTDDQSATDIIYDRLDAMTAYFESPEVKARSGRPEMQPHVTAAEHLRTAQEALATYRWINSPEAGRVDAEVQWGHLPGGSATARQRLAEWEARNLRMVAHIREAAAAAPGGRVLVIVGASHKPWFDVYLSMMADMEVVDVEAVLK
jgi:hypothetical protein